MLENIDSSITLTATHESIDHLKILKNMIIKWEENKDNFGNWLNPLPFPYSIYILLVEPG